MQKIAVILLFLLSSAACGQGFFVPTIYRGAFGNNDWTIGWTNWAPRNTSYPAGTVVVQGDISSNTTWTADKTYLLKGYVYVKNNAVLTIQPGTIIRCDVLTATCLVIAKGAKINAVGTSSSPIVFTSSEATGVRTYGDWGGILILGKGKVNVSGGVATAGAGINNANGDGLYGGSDDGDSSGVIKYMRIEFAGIQYQPDKEISALTLGAVGSKTEIDFVQISYSGNDGLSLSGGVGRIKHLVISRGYDTDINVDLGYRGFMQFGVLLRDSAKSSASGTSGIEIQNDGLASGATPNTDPTISNFTFVGPLTSLSTAYSSGYRYAVHLRRNGSCAFFNSAFAGYPRGIMLDGSATASHLKSDLVIFNASILAGMKTKALDTTGNVSSILPGFDFSSWFMNATFSNTKLTLPKDLKLSDPYNYANPSFVLKAGSALASGAEFVHPRLNAAEVKNVDILKLKFKIIQQNNLLILEPNGIFTGNSYSLTLFDLCGRIVSKRTIPYSNLAWQLPEINGQFLLFISDSFGNFIQCQKLLF